MNHQRLILASSSPRRRELLRIAGLDFTVQPSDVEESPLPGETPVEQVQRLAEAKAQDVSRAYPEQWVLGADTIVVHDGLIMGKPKDIHDAAAMLTRLSGQIHEVFTGYCVLHRSLDRCCIGHCRTEVQFKDITPSELEAYLSSGEPMGKAGAYAIQEMGGMLVKRVTGSYTNVVGLPLVEILRVFQECGVMNADAA